MAYKKTFADAVAEFMKANPGVIEQLTPEQLAERTGYSVATARDYYDRVKRGKLDKKREQEQALINASKAGRVLFVSSDGDTQVMYYPFIGEVEVIQNNKEQGWGATNKKPTLSAQSAYEVSIYLQGLRPHIREVLAKKAMYLDVAESMSDEVPDASPVVIEPEPERDQLEGH